MLNAAPRIEKVLGPAKRELDYKAATGISDYRALAVTIREKGKTTVGGLIGETYWGWMYVNVLWVAPRHRRKGHGRSLLHAAEAEARKRGVRNVFLDSFSFQAPKFYAKLGYREYGRLKGFPKGHSRHSMTKAL